jgi:hypothetical protein
MVEGTKFKVADEVLVWQNDKPKQWSCLVCKFKDVQDCEPVLEAASLPDCFLNKGYFVVEK